MAKCYRLNYDAAGRLTSETNRDARALKYEDAAGNLSNESVDGEIKTWLEQMESVVGSTGKKTSAEWLELIRKWRQQAGIE